MRYPAALRSTLFSFKFSFDAEVGQTDAISVRCQLAEVTATSAEVSSF